jgi:hypothetical protein
VVQRRLPDMDVKDPSALILVGALEMEGAIEGAGERIRDLSKAAYGDLVDVRLLAMAVLSWCLSNRARDPGSTNESVSHRITLISAFIQGQGLVERAISEGLYVRAAALLKQDVELLARIGEVKQEAAKDGITPNVKFAQGAGRLYGELNKVAHISVQSLLTLLIPPLAQGEAIGPSPIPSFQGETARELYGLHAFLCCRVALDALEVHQKLYDEESGAVQALLLLKRAHDILDSVGYLVSDRDQKADNRSGV